MLESTDNNMDIFDFDGVLADPVEEALFQLELTNDSFKLIKRMSLRHKLDLSQESHKSAHYICMQAALWDMCHPIKPGPMLGKACSSPRYHILTARSDRFAVMRMQEFIEDNMDEGQAPLKIMHVDHLPKGQMLKMLLDRHPNTRYSFYDDRQKHIDSARELKDSRLDVFHVDNDMESAYQEASTLYESILETIR